MKDALKHEFRMNGRTKFILLIIVLVFLFLSSLVYNRHYAQTKEIVTEQAISSVTNISQLNKQAVSRAIDNRLILLGVLAQKLEDNGVYDVDTILRAMHSYVDPYDFYRMGVITKDGMIHLSNGSSFQTQGFEAADKAWSSEPRVSASYLPPDNKLYAVNMFSCPMFKDNVVECVLVATYQAKKLTALINTSFMGGNEYNYIINSKGEVMLYPQSYEDKSYNALMKFINDNPSIIPEEGGNTYFDYAKRSYYAHFEKLDVNDWYLMTCAKESDVFAESTRITRKCLISNCFTWFVMAAALLSIAYLIARMRKELIKSTYYDELLNIENEKYLGLYYKQLLAEYEDEPDDLLLVAFDIDKFKEFNYLYGEDAGDALLKYIVTAFREELPEVHLFRMSADNFTTIDFCKNEEEYAAKLEKLMNRFALDVEKGYVAPFDIYAGVRKIKKGESLRHVISDALIAKGTIKGIQLRHYAFYDEALKLERLNSMRLESSFNQALKNREFCVYFQPKYDMRSRQIIGAEALVRWVKPDGTIVSPAAFIPCFEQSRQIILLDQYVLEEVCRILHRMHEDGINVPNVSVNLSRVHLKHRGILPKIAKTVKTSGIDPHLLSFEITESALFEDAIPLRNIVDFLHGLGCRVDMDDYGVGMSGLSSLAANRFDTIKLDKSFIDGIGDERMEAVIQSTIGLANTLGMRIIAEGVEEEYQAQRLVDWGCVLAQGFLYSPPIAEGAYRRLLASANNSEQ